MLIIFKLPHNFFHHKFKGALWASDSFVILKFTTVKHLCQITRFRKFLFLSSVIKFDNKWANSKQRSQSPTIVSAKSKIYSPRRGYLSPGNSIILEITATLLFIDTFLLILGLILLNSSTLPTDLFIFVTYALPHNSPDNLDATSVNTVMHSRRSIPSVFVKSIKELPFDFSVVYSTKAKAYLISNGEKWNCCRRPLLVALKIPGIYFSSPKLFIQLTFHSWAP